MEDWVVLPSGDAINLDRVYRVKVFKPPEDVFPQENIRVDLYFANTPAVVYYGDDAEVLILEISARNQSRLQYTRDNKHDLWSQ